MDFYITDGLPLGGLVQPSAAANAGSCSMKVKFGEFLKDLRINEGIALFHPAWLSIFVRQYTI